MPAPKKHYDLKKCARDGCDKLVPRVPNGGPSVYNKKKYCSASCAIAPRRIQAEKTCKNCGGLFARTRFENGRLEKMHRFRIRQFCSRKCSADAKRKAIAPRFCITCGNEIKRAGIDATSYAKRKYCSFKCRKKIYMQGKKCRYCNSFIYKYKMPDGGYESPACYNKRKFCNMNCYNLWRDEDWERRLFKRIQKEARVKGWD